MSIHVTRSIRGGWCVFRSRNRRATIRTETRAGAIAKAKQLRRKGEELFIHSADGSIQAWYGKGS